MKPFMNGSTPTVLLLHGAFADGSSWAGVVAELRGAGFDVAAPAVPLRGLAGDAAYITSVTRQFDRPLLLAGHAYGGAVATVAAAHADNVVGLVYVAGFALDVGESAAQIVTGFPRTQFAAALRPAEFCDGDGRAAVELYLRTEEFRAIYAADLPEPAAAVMAATQRPIAAAAFEEKASVAAWISLPSWYVVAAADRVLHPDVQRAMAARAGAHTVELDASHAVMLSRPAAIAAQISAAALATRRAVASS